MIIARPTTFFMPSSSDERYNWAQVRLAALDAEELDELVLDAWCMAVPRALRLPSSADEGWWCPTGRRACPPMG